MALLLKILFLYNCGVTGILLLLGIIFILPYLDSPGEIFDAIKAGIDYIKTTGVPTG